MQPLTEADLPVSLTLIYFIEALAGEQARRGNFTEVSKKKISQTPLSSLKTEEGRRNMKPELLRRSLKMSPRLRETLNTALNVSATPWLMLLPPVHTLKEEFDNITAVQIKEGRRRKMWEKEKNNLYKICTRIQNK